MDKQISTLRHSRGRVPSSDLQTYNRGRSVSSVCRQCENSDGLIHPRVYFCVKSTLYAKCVRGLQFDKLNYINYFNN